MAFTDGSQAYKLERDVYRPSRARVRAKATVLSKATSTRQMIDVVIISIAILALGILYVAQHATMALVGDQLFNEQKSLQELKAENGQLKLQVMRLSALSRVERLARQDGKMVEPGRIEYVALSQMPKSRVSSRAAYSRGRVDTINLDGQKLAKPAHVAVE